MDILDLRKTSHSSGAASTEADLGLSRGDEPIGSSTRETRGMASDGAAGDAGIVRKSSKTTLPGGTVHTLPDDFAAAIEKSAKVTKVWNDITPLARNEWICWVISGKLEATREKRIKVGISKMTKGERRPCCWVGCIHRTDKAMSPSQKWVTSRQTSH